MDARSHVPRSAGPPGAPVSRSPQRPSTQMSGGMSRAERFEDEKKRIVESCFSKVDESGALAESYITHIRITEDSSFPQTPHPPDSLSANKERLIIVAVRNTGRVRVHKARENANQSFSIGKTWNLEDLSAIQSWANYTPRNEEEARYKGWAGDTGFTATMIKPYYWQASTAKEKGFFVASLVKIYRKYTQGKVPDLIGFPPGDVEQMVGQQSRSPMGESPGRPPQIPPFSPGRPRGLSSGEIPTSSPQLPLEPPPRNRPPTSSSVERSFFAQRSPSSQGSGTPPPGSLYPADPRRELERMGSREQMRPAGLSSAGQTIPQSSMLNMGPARDRTPDPYGSGSLTQGAAPIPDRRSPSRTRDDIQSRDGPRPPNGLGIVNRLNGAQNMDHNGGMPIGMKSGPVNGFNGPGRPSNASQDSLPETAIPERRRPPLGASMANGSQASLRGSNTSLNRPSLTTAASGSTDSLLKGKVERMPGGFASSPAPSNQNEREGLLPQTSSSKSKMDTSNTPAPLPAPSVAPAVQPAAQSAIQSVTLAQPAVQPSLRPEVKEVPKQESMSTSAASPGMDQADAEARKREEEEAARPGLGRMFGNKQKTAKEMFKTAASAYGAFVPRAGGAAARLRAAAADENKGPDGVTGVVPAPGLARARTDESMTSLDTPKDESSIQATPTSAKPGPADELPIEIVPEVTVSSPMSPQRDVKSPPPAPEVDQDAAAALAAQKKAKLAEEEAARKRKRRSAQQMKYLSRLGVDGSMLENQGLDFETVLDDIGWGNSAFQNKNIEALEGDIRREISRVEAGSWLGHLEQKDDRVEAVEKLLDRAIAECDELDGLLTLYSVELSSLNDDIAFIEAQSQGLQVHTANQKLLQLELQNLVDTISIDSQQLEPLKKPMPANAQGLDSIEKSLLMLYKAMVTIDPRIRQSSNGIGNQGNSGMMANSEISNMMALQSKNDQYVAECNMFLKRFTQHMDLTFGAATLSARDVIGRQRGANGAKLSTEPYDAMRLNLWQYSPLMLFAKEIGRPRIDRS